MNIKDFDNAVQPLNLKKKIGEMDNFKMSDLKSQTDVFKYRGVYILCDDTEIIYIGSAYARDILNRLLQYLHEKDTGNTLLSDLKSEIYKDKTDKEILEKIKEMTVYAFEDESLEYKLINVTNSFGNTTVNKNGKKK